MNGDGWSEAELAVLGAYTDQRDWLGPVAAQLPHRSLSALRNRMALLRREMGLRDRGMAWFHNDARRGSQRLLAALEQRGLRAA